MARDENWLQKVLKDAALRVRAYHKFWHLSEDQLREFAGDWTDADCPYGDTCSFKH